jgi:short-subunit dehydrogenase
MQDLAQLGAHVLKMDVTVEEDIVNGINTINENHGGVDILVNNAGYALYGAIEDVTIDEARRQFEVNIFGLARLTQLVIPHMRKQRSGKIINVSSVGGKIYSPLDAWYHATKHALEGWSDCLRLELMAFNIDVVVIEPGAIVTEFGDVMMQPLLERSENGPYAELAHNLATGTERNYADGSPPSVIAEVISKAVKANKPKTRYAAGRLARTILTMRKILPDRMFDRMVLNLAS